MLGLGVALVVAIVVLAVVAVVVCFVLEVVLRWEAFWRFLMFRSSFELKSADVL